MLALMVIFDLLTSSNAAVTFSLVVPDGPISGPLGSSVVLPCTLSPSLDCKGYKISWYRPNNDDNPVLLYEDLKVQENAGDPQYRGRAFLVGDLKKGNVSLKLENLTLADRGEYVCYVNAYKWYEKASVFTTVTVVGSLPYLSLAEVGDQVNVTCASDGWSPKPTLIWRDKTGKGLKNISEYYLEDSEGLVGVRSWLMFSPSDSEGISCSVGLSDQEMKEGRVLPLKTLQSGWKAAFIVLLVIFVLGMSLLIFLIIKGHVWRKTSKPPQTDEEAAPLVGEITPPPCAVCTERELNRADGETLTSGEINPPPCAVYTERKINTADGETQTSGEIRPPPCAVFTEREINRAERGTQTSGPETADKEVNTVKEKGPETVDKETCTDGETQADPAPIVKDTSNDKETKGKLNSLSKSASDLSALSQTQGTLNSLSRSASVPTDLSQTKDSKTNNTKIHGDNKTAASPLPEISKTQDSNTNNPKRNKEKEKPDFNMMLGRKVAIKPESETDLGVLFKERIRAGQYYWEVNGLTGPSVRAPSLRTNQQNKCPESWYVGVISETVLKNQLQLSPQNCWVLHYDKEKGFYVNDPSLTPVPVKDWFSKLGVFIDCEKNTLSFYNYGKSSHLYTFCNVDCTQPLVPVVFPGLRSQYSFEISERNCVKCDELYQQYGTRKKQSWS